MNGSYGRCVNIEACQGTGTPTVQPAVTSKPHGAVARLADRTNIADAWKKMKLASIEPVQLVARHPVAALAILEQCTETWIRQAFFPSISYERRSPKAQQPRANCPHPAIALAIYQKPAYLGQVSVTRWPGERLRTSELAVHYPDESGRSEQQQFPIAVVCHQQLR